MNRFITMPVGILADLVRGVHLSDAIIYTAVGTQCALSADPLVTMPLPDWHVVLSAIVALETIIEFRHVAARTRRADIFGRLATFGRCFRATPTWANFKDALRTLFKR